MEVISKFSICLAAVGKLSIPLLAIEGLSFIFKLLWLISDSAVSL